MSFEIILYEKKNGDSPIDNFIRKMPDQSRAKLHMIIDLLKEKGPDVRMPYSRYLNDGIFEIRLLTGRDSFRVLYFFMAEKKIIFTNGFKKKTEKTPLKEIKIAIAYREDYLRRNYGK